MQQYKYLIIGGGVAGTTAAEIIRKEDPSGSIAILSDEPHRLYSRIMLSKPAFFLEKVPFDSVWMKKESWYDEKNIAFLGGKRATKIETEKKIMELDGGDELGYEKLLLATGACARPWSVPGSEKDGVFVLRTMDEGKEIMKARKSAKCAMVIGGGFISFEVADLLQQAGVEVTVVLMDSYFWQPMLSEISGRAVEKAMETAGVKIIHNTAVQEVEGNDRVTGVVLKDGSKLPCEMIVAGIGIICPLDWLKTSSIKTNRGILANEYLETNAPDVWAAGDVAEFNDLILEETIQLGSWMNAQEQGRAAGLNMVGKKTPFKKVTFYTTHGFGMTVGFVGDARPAEGREIILRNDEAKNSFAQLIAIDGELVGGTFVNRTNEIQTLTKLIENNVKVSDKLPELADPNFDLSTLL
ncbi:MAG: FAD-dependent oxidoreductase [bacterium]|nr:FAD-dependent oxidoreductase [bacterium]